MYCNKCGIVNEKDAMFCKHCGNNLIKEYINKDVSSKKYEKVVNNKKIINKKNVKNVTKTKQINRVEQKKNNQKKNSEVKVIKKMTGFQKFMFLLLITIILVLIGVIFLIGLFVVDKYTKEVPYVVGMTYEQAKEKLESLDFTVSKKEIDGADDIVLKQNRKNGTRVINGSNVILYVGTKEETLPNLIGLSKEAAITILEKYDIKYEIKMIDSNSEGVLSQNYKKNTRIKDIDVLKLEVGVIKKVQKEEKEEIKEEKEKTTENEESNL